MHTKDGTYRSEVEEEISGEEYHLWSYGRDLSVNIYRVITDYRLFTCSDGIVEERLM